MRDDDLYQSWIESKRADVPDGFADRVMDRVESGMPRRDAFRWLFVHPVAMSRVAIVGIGVLAILACLARLRHAVSLFMPS